MNLIKNMFRKKCGKCWLPMHKSEYEHVPNHYVKLCHTCEFRYTDCHDCGEKTEINRNLHLYTFQRCGACVIQKERVASV